MTVLPSAMQNVLLHVGACVHKPSSSVRGYVHLPGQSGTRLTAYHNYGMWLVLSNT
jgi:hypothetical protein